MQTVLSRKQIAFTYLVITLQISLAVNDVPLTGIQTVIHFNIYFTSTASDLVGKLSNNNNHPYGDNNFYVTCVLLETSEDEVKSSQMTLFLCRISGFPCIS